MNQIKKIVLFALLFVVQQAFATPWQDNQKIQQLFKQAGVTGTFVVYDVSKDQLTGFNHKRAQTRFIPASTFKIPNSLIGLETGAISSVDEILPYGGGPQYMKSWERDMSLRDAIKVSNLSIYKELARRITLKRMQSNVKTLNYGNAKISNNIERFWLDGSLKISAIEQTAFLAKLANGTLPISAKTQTAVREISLLEQGKNWQLYGKTGWSNSTKPGTGWWVGWVKKDNKIYSFALNMNMSQIQDAEKRISLGKDSLKVLGILD